MEVNILEKTDYDRSSCGACIFGTGKQRPFLCRQKLPVRYRKVVHLYYYEEYSIREIAELLKISETAIQTRLMRARRKLKTMLKEAWK